MVVILSQQVNSACSLTVPSAVDELNQIMGNRSQVIADAQQVSADAPAQAAIARELIDAMNVSLNADQAWKAWFITTYQAYSNTGCQGAPTTNGDPNWDSFVTLSNESDAKKEQFVNDYDPQALQFGYEGDWQTAQI